MFGLVGCMGVSALSEGAKEGTQHTVAYCSASRITALTMRLEALSGQTPACASSQINRHADKNTLRVIFVHVVHAAVDCKSDALCSISINHNNFVR